MLSTSARLLPRRIAAAARPATRRYLSTAPPTQKSRSWKSSAVRWGLAAGGIYYYNTYASDVFAEGTDEAINRLDTSLHRIQDAALPTVDAIVAEKHARTAAQAAANRSTSSQVEPSPESSSSNPADYEAHDHEGSLEDLEEEADQQAAFNPETGEINWDCPCLGGMAHGPCGEEFREAFSCFVYSKEEPKGMECIDKFKGMQDCFRAHPEMYGSELEDDEDEVEAELAAQEAAPSQHQNAKAPAPTTSEEAQTPTGSAKAKAQELGTELQEGAENAKQHIQTSAEHVKAKVQSEAADVRSKVQSTAADAKSKVQTTAESAKAKAQTATQSAKSKVQSSAESAKSTISEKVSGSSAHHSATDAASPSTSGDEGGELVPKAVFDATSENEKFQK